MAEFLVWMIKHLAFAMSLLFVFKLIMRGKMRGKGIVFEFKQNSYYFSQYLFLAVGIPLLVMFHFRDQHIDINWLVCVGMAMIFCIILQTHRISLYCTFDGMGSSGSHEKRFMIRNLVLHHRGKQSIPISEVRIVMIPAVTFRSIDESNIVVKEVFDPPLALMPNASQPIGIECDIINNDQQISTVGKADISKFLVAGKKRNTGRSLRFYMRSIRIDVVSDKKTITTELFMN